MHAFWDKQPVAKSQESLNSFITEIPVEERLRLPDQFEWQLLSLEDDLDRIYKFLYDNYSESDTGRLVYSKDTLKWLLRETPRWLVGVNLKDTKKLVGFITGIAINLRVNGQDLKTAEINLLCVHKKLRDKRLTPVLVTEVKRLIRIHSEPIRCAIYTIPIDVSLPITEYTYYHRMLHVSEMSKIGSINKKYLKEFIPSRLDYTEYSFKVVTHLSDLKIVYDFYKQRYTTLEMYQEYTFDEFSTKFKSIPGVVKTLLMYKDLKPMGYISYFYLDTFFLKTSTLLKRVQVYHTVSNTDPMTLMREWIKHLYKTETDIYRIDVLNVNDMKRVIEDNECKFEKGSGVIKCCMYNYHVKKISNDKQGYFPI